MTTFIQVHFLTSYPPSNLNRDDLGSPKTAIMGGSKRLRISSQSLKRAWRTSALFQEALEGHIGIRTKMQGEVVYKKFIQAGIEEKPAREWAQKIAEQFGKLKKPEKKKTDQEDLHIEQLAHISNEELAVIDVLIQKCVEHKKAPAEEDLNLLRKENSMADIACFGRMLASSPVYNVDASIQVAHAITTHKIDIEDDFFTAVDDLNDETEDAGAGHLGEMEFAAGLFYGYICIDRNLLKKNLGEDEELTQKTIKALLECVAKVSPTGKQNSFASRAYTSYMMAEKGRQQPRSLSVAFLKPILEKKLFEDSLLSLENHRTNIDKVYGSCAEKIEKFNAVTGEGTLEKVINFAAEDL